MSKYYKYSSLPQNNRVPFNNILIEVFYSMMLSHHVPSMFRHGGFFGQIKLVDFSSIGAFLTSYIGKILFLIIIFSILHYIVLPKARKIDINKFNKDLNK